jgi:hypothetical protein
MHTERFHDTDRERDSIDPGSTTRNVIWVGRIVSAAVVAGLIGGAWQGDAGSVWCALGLGILLASIPDPQRAARRNRASAPADRTPRAA